MFGKNAKSLYNNRVTIKLRTEGIFPLISWGPNSLELYISEGFPVGVNWLGEILIKMAKYRMTQLENQRLEQNSRGREVGRSYTHGVDNNSIFQVVGGPPVLLLQNPAHIYNFFIHLMINLCRWCQYWLERNFMVMTYIPNTFNIYIYIYIYIHIIYIYI